jgi:HK97 gp10 family phage protein
MGAVTVTITGDKELVRKLRRLGDDMSGRLLEAAVVSGALLVQNEAKRKAPVKTGNLRRSIHIGGHSDKSELAESDGTDIGGNAASPTGAHVLVGTNVVYGPAQEFGTSTIPAHPYLRPALDEQKDAVRVEIGEALKDLILRATR